MYLAGCLHFEQGPIDDAVSLDPNGGKVITASVNADISNKNGSNADQLKVVKDPDMDAVGGISRLFPLRKLFTFFMSEIFLSTSD